MKDLSHALSTRGEFFLNENFGGVETISDFLESLGETIAQETEYTYGIWVSTESGIRVYGNGFVCWDEEIEEMIS